MLESLLRAWQKLWSAPVLARLMILLLISSTLVFVVGVPLGYHFLEGIAAGECADWQCEVWKILKMVGVSFAFTLGLIAIWCLVFYVLLSTFFANFLIRYAHREYPSLKGEPHLLKFIFYQLKIFALYSVALLISLPFWLLPGVSVLVLLLGTTFLNRFLFINEILFEYASPDEQKAVLAKNNKDFWLLGFVCSLGLLVPFLNLIVPMWAALAHYDFTFSKILEQRKV